MSPVKVDGKRVSVVERLKLVKPLRARQHFVSKTIHSKPAAIITHDGCALVKHAGIEPSTRVCVTAQQLTVGIYVARHAVISSQHHCCAFAIVAGVRIWPTAHITAT